MCEVEFNHNSNIDIIQCNKDEKIRDIIRKFLSKTNLDINSINFIYSGNMNIDYNLSFEEIASDTDKLRNKIIILVNDKNIINEEEITIKSTNVICPICQEYTRINIEAYNIFLFGCKDNHKLDNILLNEFEDKQKINLSKIKCGICGNSKGKTFKNIFYKCHQCKINICPLCKLAHDKSHIIINYDDAYYTCDMHNNKYILYCKNCKQNLCLYCENEHNNHELFSYGKIMPKIDEIKLRMKELKENIDKFKEDINKMMDILNKTKKNMEY